VFSGGSLWDLATAGAWQCLRCGALVIPGDQGASCPRCGGTELAR
jgi:rubrerythrin